MKLARYSRNIKLIGLHISDVAWTTIRKYSTLVCELKKQEGKNKRIDQTDIVLLFSAA